METSHKSRIQRIGATFFSWLKYCCLNLSLNVIFYYFICDKNKKDTRQQKRIFVSQREMARNCCWCCCCCRFVRLPFIRFESASAYRTDQIEKDAKWPKTEDARKRKDSIFFLLCFTQYFPLIQNTLLNESNELRVSVCIRRANKKQ